MQIKPILLFLGGLLWLHAGYSQGSIRLELLGPFNGRLTLGTTVPLSKSGRWEAGAELGYQRTTRKRYGITCLFLCSNPFTLVEVDRYRRRAIRTTLFVHYFLNKRRQNRGMYFGGFYQYSYLRDKRFATPEARVRSHLAGPQMGFKSAVSNNRLFYTVQVGLGAYVGKQFDAATNRYRRQPNAPDALPWGSFSLGILLGKNKTPSTRSRRG